MGGARTSATTSLCTSPDLDHFQVLPVTYIQQHWFGLPASVRVQHRHMWEAGTFLFPLPLCRTSCYMTLCHKHAPASKLPPAFRQPSIPVPLTGTYPAPRIPLLPPSHLSQTTMSFPLLFPLQTCFSWLFFFFSQVGLQAGPAAGSGAAGNTIRGVACPPRAKEWVTVIWEMRLFRLLDYAQLWAKALLSAGNAFQKVAFRGLRPQNINTTTLLPVVLLSSKCFNSGLSYAWFGLVRCRWRLRNQLPWQHWTDC